MTLPDSLLVVECEVFTKHLIQTTPSDYIISAYARAHSCLPLVDHTDSFDRKLLAMARRSPLLTRFADGYARLFAPRSLLRKKLILLLAILESSAPYSAAFELDHRRPVSNAFLGCLFAGAAAMAALSIAILIFAPLQIFYAVPRQVK